jgi:hypothetical protein
VTDDDTVPDACGIILRNMHHGKILDVGAFPDGNGCNIAADYGVVPDAAVFFDGDVTDDMSAGSNIDG